MDDIGGKRCGLEAIVLLAIIICVSKGRATVEYQCNKEVADFIHKMALILIVDAVSSLLNIHESYRGRITSICLYFQHASAIHRWH